MKKKFYSSEKVFSCVNEKRFFVNIEEQCFLMTYLPAALTCVSARKLVCFTDETCNRDLAGFDHQKCWRRLRLCYTNIQLPFAYSLYSFKTWMLSLVSQSETGEFWQKCWNSGELSPGSLYILKEGGLKWGKWKPSRRWQFKVNCKQKPCKIQLEYITCVYHVANHAQFSTKWTKFPLFSNELLNEFYIWTMTDNTYFETPPGMRRASQGGGGGGQVPLSPRKNWSFSLVPQK